MLLTNAKVACLNSADDYGLIEDAVIAISGEHIDWVGPKANLPNAFLHHEALDLAGRLVTPGFIDCHTHVVFGGNRAAEFEQRLNGATYEEVARAGGGIISTVKQTREASEGDLLKDALRRVDAMIAEGVTQIEVKSGYGLDVETELKMLRVARNIAQSRPISVQTSFLGAHSIPQEYT